MVILLLIILEIVIGSKVVYEDKIETKKETITSRNETTKQTMTITFRRSGNVVNCNVKIAIDKNAPTPPNFIKFSTESSSGYGIFAIPSWAKTNEKVEDSSLVLSSFSHIEGNATDTVYLAKGLFRKFSDSKYTLFGTINYAAGMASEMSFTFSYIVE